MEVISELVTKFGQIWPAEVRGSLLERTADAKGEEVGGESTLNEVKPVREED